MKKLIYLTVIVISLSCLTGCEKTPMEKLASDKQYPELKTMLEQAHKEKGQFWEDALKYCHLYMATAFFIPKEKKINCEYVADIKEKEEMANIGKLNMHPTNSRW